MNRPEKPIPRTVYTIEHRCSDCGGLASQSFAEEIGHGRLIWWEAWSCEGCGFRTEGDGWDRLPDEPRDHVLAKEGSFRVDVHPRSRLGLLRVLREEFEMSLRDAAIVYDLLPSGFRTRLTHKEAVVLASKFPDDVADAKVEAEPTEASTS